MNKINTLIKPERDYYLDWIRSGIVLLLVPYHCAVTFSHIGKGYIYTATADPSLFFSIGSDFLNLWFMRTLFLVSGMAAFKALRFRSVRQFLLQRVNKLLLPVIFMLIVVNPAAGYLLAVNHFGFQGGFLDFYPDFFLNPKQYLFWGHMWYCVYLFIFSIATIPLFTFLNRNSRLARINNFLQKKAIIFLPLAAAGLIELLLRPLYPGYQSFIGDWANVAVYLFFYCFGYIIAGNEPVMEKFTGYSRVLLISGTAAGILFIWLKRFFPNPEELAYFEQIKSFTWGVSAYLLCMGITGASRRLFNKSGKMLAFLSNSSFSVYMFHYLAVSIFNTILLKTGLNNISVWALSTVCTYAVLFLLFEFILKRIKPMRFICSIKK